MLGLWVWHAQTEIRNDGGGVRPPNFGVVWGVFLFYMQVRRLQLT
jgi:hypothetical protein